MSGFRKPSQLSMIKSSVHLGAALVVILLRAVSSLAAEDNGFIRDQNQCLARNTSPQSNETITWTGGCKNGFADGEGIQQWYINNAPTYRYEGRMEGGIRNGFGKSTASTNTRTYEGEWRDGRFHGKGVLVDPQGNRFDGTWEAGQLVGKATVTYRNGAGYEGEIKNLRPQGKGFMTYNDGGRYDGEWNNGQRNGRGVLTWRDNARYEGDWKQGEREGRGVMTYGDGSRYEGEWKHGRREGSGVVTNTGDRKSVV